MRRTKQGSSLVSRLVTPKLKRRSPRPSYGTHLNLERHRRNVFAASLQRFASAIFTSEVTSFMGPAGLLVEW